MTADLADGYASSDVQSQLDEALNQYLLLPVGVEIEMAGQMNELSGYMGHL